MNRTGKKTPNNPKTTTTKTPNRTLSRLPLPSDSTPFCLCLALFVLCLCGGLIILLLPLPWCYHIFFTCLYLFAWNMVFGFYLICVVCVLPFFCLFKSQFNSQWHIHPRQIKNNNYNLFSALCNMEWVTCLLNSDRKTHPENALSRHWPSTERSWAKVL